MAEVLVPMPEPGVIVLGAGAWGTALAVQIAQRKPVTLWVRDPAQAASMQSLRCNTRYLPGIALPPALEVTSDFEGLMAQPGHHLWIIATPLSGLAGVLKLLYQTLSVRLPGSGLQVLWLCKGFQEVTALLPHEVAQSIAPNMQVGVLSGPSFALEVATGQPTALVVASTDQRLCAQTVAALHGGAVRVYTSTDPVGVEVGGAVKNVLAIAAGIADGFEGQGLGMNARAALITRGLAEMTRLGVALGARSETFMGLSGLGDLVLTTTGHLSRNRQVGLRLARGDKLPHILAELGHVAEGVLSAPMVLYRANALGVEMPIVESVVRLLQGQQTVQQAVEMLMDRRARSEEERGTSSTSPSCL